MQVQDMEKTKTKQPQTSMANANLITTSDKQWNTLFQLQVNGDGLFKFTLEMSRKGQ